MLHRNLEWKLAAVLLAVCLWAYVTVTEQVGERAFRVAVTAARIPPQLALTSAPGDAVIWLRGARELLEIAGGQVQARAYPLENRAGKVTARIDAIYPPNLTLVKVTPPEITVQLEKITKKRLPVSTKLEGTPAPGYLLGTPTVNPGWGGVSGPENAVARAYRLLLRVDVASAVLGQPQSGLLIPVDRAGRMVADLKIEPQTAVATVPMERTVASRMLPVFVSVVGQPKEGFQLKGITVEPSLVTVAGDTAALKTTDSISTLPLQVSQAAASFTRRLTLVAPVGAASLSNSSVLVKVTVVPAAPDKSSKLRSSVQPAGN